jgi:diaminopimelate epimerase
MLLTFTKMHGLGNDFIVIDAYSKHLNYLPADYLTKENIQYLANRHLGIGADQILIIEKSLRDDCDFKYRIFNADGYEVEHCGNGARCFMRYIYDKGLTHKKSVQIEIMQGQLTLSLLDNNLIEVAMGRPQTTASSVYFNINNYSNHNNDNNNTDKGNINTLEHLHYLNYTNEEKCIGVVSMGNPHAVMLVKDVDNYPVHTEGAWLESHPQFTQRVNAGFMEIIDAQHIKLRVFERGAGETMACGTGACAAVVSGIHRKLLQSPVCVQTKGGNLYISWSGLLTDTVFMQGEAVTVFEGQITI